MIRSLLSVGIQGTFNNKIYTFHNNTLEICVIYIYVS